MINRLLLGRQSPLQVILMIIGVFAGLFLLLGSGQIYLDIKKLLSAKNELIRPQYLVINKNVSLLNTISGKTNTFSPEEIRALEDLKEVEKVGKFTACQYSVKLSASTGDDGFPLIYSELFFESVLDEFLDVKGGSWHWRPGSDDLPIIVPADYLNLYNFGYAPGQNLPQLSPGAIQMASFDISIEGQGKTKTYKGHIAGFTNRINTILVPQAFMDYSNNEFGNARLPKGPTRLVLLCPDPSSPALLKYLEEHHYQTNEELLKSSRLNSLLSTITGVIMSVALLIIGLSLLSFIQYAQLLIQRAEYELRTLILLGYNYLHLWKRYVILYSIVLVLLLATVGIVLYLFLKYFTSWMEAKGFTLGGIIHWEVILLGVVIVLIMILMQAVAIFVNLRKLAKGR